MKFLLPLLLVTLFCTTSFAQRQTVLLTDGWKFVKHDAAPDAAVSGEWEAVRVPHCWNALDGQDGKQSASADTGKTNIVDSDKKGDYYRGPAWYVRSLDVPADWKDKRVFIRFGAAFLVADVYLNGEHMGQHRGGFAAFCYELTSHLKVGGSNELRVRVDNAQSNDIAPISADFTMEGGLYRPVELIVTNQTCITPLDYAGPGVYVTATNISVERADLTVETKLDSVDKADGRRLVLETTIVDPEGKIFLRSPFMGTAPSGAHKDQFSLQRPHLWNGIKNPYIYSVTVKLRQAAKDKKSYELIDEVTVPLGFRTVAVDQEKGFLLNGQPYKVYGVNRHQEKRDQGWALSDADHDADFQTIREMGATAVRLAHYQQAEHVRELGDKTGLLLWQEIPLVDEIDAGDAFAENAKQQLTEEIRQSSNHPSIMTWSLFNELYLRKSPPVEPLITALDKLARELDPSRIPSGVTCRPDRTELNHLPEWIGANMYPGWYSSKPEEYPQAVKRFFDSAGANRRIAVTEYGAGSNTTQHQEGALVQPKPTGVFHPEEWQTFVHERAWHFLKDDPHVWGTFIWCMFDFASDGRSEGSNPGVNDKGMVTEDRKIKKDAFYFYKANWNPEPMVYVASRRSTPRKEAQTEVQAFSNAGEVELTVNGQTVGKAKPDDVQVCRWPGVTLKPGVNRVEVVAHAADGKELRDQCEWTLEAAAATAAAGTSATP